MLQFLKLYYKIFKMHKYYEILTIKLPFDYPASWLEIKDVVG